MKKLLSFVTIILSIRSLMSVDPMTKCERRGQQTNNDVNTENEIEEEMPSTSDYLEFNNKKVEKVTTVNRGKLNVDNDGNIYFQDGQKLFIRRRSERNAVEIGGIVLSTFRLNEIFIDRKFNTTFVGTENGLFFVHCGGTRAVQLRVTKTIIVDFGIIDSFGNIYFGTDGSNTDLSEQMYVFDRKLNKLTKIKGIETTLGSYPIETRGNRNKIAIDSKNNIYVGAYSNYIYLIEPSGTAATKIKDNRDYGSVTSIVIDSKDNIYCRTYKDLYIVRNKKFMKILETIDYYDLFLSLDKDENLHFRIANDEYALMPKEMSAIEIVIDKNVTNIILSKNLMIRNNIFYFTTRDGNGDETICAIKQFESNVTEIYKIREYYSIAIDNDNNIYFTADNSKISNKITPYVLRANAKMPIEIRGVTGRLSNAYGDNKNNVYFSASNGLHILNFDEVVPHRLRTTGSQINSLVVAKDGHIYFGTDYDGAFVLKAGESEAIKISGINKEYGPVMAVKTFADKNYDIIYIQTNGALYKLMGGDTVVNRVVESGSYQFYLSDCQNNTYYVNGNDVFLMKSGASMPNKIAIVFGQVLSVDIDSSNKLFFGTTIGLQVLSTGETMASLVHPIHRQSVARDTTVSLLAIDKDDNVYFGINGDAFVLKSGELEATKINGISGGVVKIFINNNDIYFITNLGKRLFLLQNKFELSRLFENRILGEIDDNNDDTILNTLNYLNIENDYLLSQSKNKLINKTETSAIVVAKRGKYVGQFSVEYKIIDRDENDRKYFVDIDFLKKAIYFNYVNENLFHYRKTKEIKSIEVDIGNLRFSRVEASKKSDLISSFDFHNVCNSKVVANSSPVNQVSKFPQCNYTGKEVISFEIKTGINKPNVDEFTQVLTPADEITVSDFLYNSENSTEPVMLSPVFELSNSNRFSQEKEIYDFFEPEQEIVIPPSQKIEVKYSVRTFTNKINLSLIQKIQGVIVAKVIDISDEQIIQITLRNAMQVLEKYSQLPVEVVINDDNSISFNGKATLISSSESKPKPNILNRNR